MLLFYRFRSDKTNNTKLVDVKPLSYFESKTRLLAESCGRVPIVRIYRRPLQEVTARKEIFRPSRDRKHSELKNIIYSCKKTHTHTQYELMRGKICLVKSLLSHCL